VPESIHDHFHPFEKNHRCCRMSSRAAVGSPPSCTPLQHKRNRATSTVGNKRRLLRSGSIVVTVLLVLLSRILPLLGRALQERSQLRFLWAFLFQLCGRIPSVIYRIYQVARDYAEGPPLAAEGILKACRCQSERASMTTSRN